MSFRVAFSPEINETDVDYAMQVYLKVGEGNGIPRSVIVLLFPFVLRLSVRVAVYRENIISRRK